MYSAFGGKNKNLCCFSVFFWQYITQKKLLFNSEYDYILIVLLILFSFNLFSVCVCAALQNYKYQRIFPTWADQWEMLCVVYAPYQSMLCCDNFGNGIKFTKAKVVAGGCDWFFVASSFQFDFRSQRRLHFHDLNTVAVWKRKMPMIWSNCIEILVECFLVTPTYWSLVTRYLGW